MNLHDHACQHQREAHFTVNGFVELDSRQTLSQELDDIRTLLKKAMVLEHTVIPPYLTLLYTLNDDSDHWILNVIRSVVVEEMLHFVLVGNLLNAVGGSPEVNSPDFLPDYPAPLPFGIDDLEIQLHAFSPHAIHQAMQIEHPKYVRPEVVANHVCSDMTIGEFYVYIESRLRAAVKAFGEKAVFCGDANRQIAPEHFTYGAGSNVIPVYDLNSATEAVRVIYHQGEGSPNQLWLSDDGEIAHYYRFNEIYRGRRYVSCDTIASGPSGVQLTTGWEHAVKTHSGLKVSDYPAGDEQAAIVRFNRRYCELLEQLQQGLCGKPQKLMPALASMHALRDDFLHIVRMPYPGDNDYSCAPTFEYTPPKVTTSPSAVLDVSFSSNQSTLSTLMLAYASGDVQKAVACMSEHIVWDISGPIDVPYAGVFYGHDGFNRYWSLMEQTVEFSSIGTENVFFNGNEAMAYGGEQGITKTTRMPYSYDWAIRYEFNEDHKVVLMRQYFNPMRIQAALAASPTGGASGG
ncbi:hypothetical protein AU490_01100 [Lonsdalea populi]|uniref:Iminophenyl-pyruvate dimer synthase domain-containing protein n=1 Tax=Lonsdalea populi TaxID=1172565 RepID=A0A3N0UX46_9GAMM|nr:MULTISPECIES: ferritin-like domain-containing protein [Lonsdalea]OSM99634.1 hypothetical protein AU508_01300 [Lonsdalea populi]OSN02588.1 hypothetical protein AU499_00320 [Lonsdalea populi]QPQ25654.1 nuclear transport factor 2 family protein [Lonsdalea populi]RAT18179.1 hypothetical protein AU486_02350 [Lonsdalea quercina]RAT31046.1 hypothetical protein AU490_01100 [Lonsdalea populi]